MYEHRPTLSPEAFGWIFLTNGRRLTFKLRIVGTALGFGVARLIELLGGVVLSHGSPDEDNPDVIVVDDGILNAARKLYEGYLVEVKDIEKCFHARKNQLPHPDLNAVTRESEKAIGRQNGGKPVKEKGTLSEGQATAEPKRVRYEPSESGPKASHLSPLIPLKKKIQKRPAATSPIVAPLVEGSAQGSIETAAGPAKRQKLHGSSAGLAANEKGELPRGKVISRRSNATNKPEKGGATSADGSVIKQTQVPIEHMAQFTVWRTPFKNLTELFEKRDDIYDKHIQACHDMLDEVYKMEVVDILTSESAKTSRFFLLLRQILLVKPENITGDLRALAGLRNRVEGLLMNYDDERQED